MIKSCTRLTWKVNIEGCGYLCLQTTLIRLRSQISLPVEKWLSKAGFHSSARVRIVNVNNRFNFIN